MKCTTQIAAALQVLFLCLGTSCVSKRVAGKLDEHYGTQREELKSLLAQLDDDTDAKTIRWSRALAKMKRDNLGLSRSKELLEDARKERKRQWRELIPRVTGFVNLSQGLDSLLEVDGDDLNSSLSASFNIPNPFNFYGSLYASALRLEDARYSNQLDQRRAYVELYKAFMNARHLREERRELQLKMASWEGGEAEQGADEIYRVQQNWLRLEQRHKTHRVNVNRLFNTPGANWDLVGKVPDVSVRDKYQNFVIGEDFGKLALYLYAIRIESAILVRERVKYRQWPLLSFGLSQPPLHSSARSNDYELENFRLFSGASKSIELMDPLGLEQIQNAQQRFAYTRKMMRQRVEREALQFNNMKKSYRQLLLTEMRLLKAREIIESSASKEGEVVLVQLEALRDNSQRLRDVRNRITNLELQYLIWNETFWDS